MLSKKDFLELRKRGLTTKQIIESEERYQREDLIQKPAVVPEREKSQSTLGSIGEIGAGIKKGTAQSILGLASTPERGGKWLAEKTLGAMGYDKEKIPEPFKREAKAPLTKARESEMLEAETPWEKVGKGAEQIGEMFTPVGLKTKLVPALSKIPALSKNPVLLKNVIKTLYKSFITGAEFGGKTLFQTGDIKEAKEAGVISAVVPVAGRVIKATGGKIAESAISLSAKEAKIVQAYKANVPFWNRVFAGDKAPVTAGVTAFKKRLVGTESMIGIQATKAKKNLWDNLISPQLKKSTVKIDMKSLFKETEKEIIKDNPELSRQKSLLTALNSLKDDYAKIKNVNLIQLQKLKEGWAKFLPDKVYKGKPIAGAFNDVKSIVAGISRDKIHNSIIPGARRAYFDYGNLIGLQELGQKAMTGGKFKGGAGSYITALLDMGLTPIKTIGGQVIYRTGQGIEMIGKQGAKTIADLFK